MITLTVLYTVLFVYIRIQSKYIRKASSSQELSANEHGKWRFDIENDDHGHPSTTQMFPRNLQQSAPEQRLSRASKIMLCYPAIYFVLVLPLAVARIMEFDNKNWSLTAVYVGGALFDCQGWVNVILYTATRQGIISWDKIFRKRKSNSGKGSATSTFDSQPPRAREFSVSTLPDKDLRTVESAFSIVSIERSSVAGAAKY